MSRLELSISTWDYDRVRALIDGRVAVEGCDVNYVVLPPEECFARAWSGAEFDVAELGFTTYLMTLARGDAPYVGIPVFLSRMFRHSAIYVRTDRGIERPEDLRGKHVGVPLYEMAAAVWVRGLLQDEYGVAPDDVRWHRGGLGPEKAALLSRMLADGELDAVIAARAPACFEAGHPQVARLFPDYRTVERDYFRRTRIFPIMHVVGVRPALAERHPWLPASLLKAFSSAKRLADAELREVTALKVGLPWVTAEFAATVEAMGPDFWPYGLEHNRPTLDAMAAYVNAQGLTARPIDVAEMFASTNAH